MQLEAAHLQQVDYVGQRQHHILCHCIQIVPVEKEIVQLEDTDVADERELHEATVYGEECLLHTRLLLQTQEWQTHQVGKPQVQLDGSQCAVCRI